MRMLPRDQWGPLRALAPVEHLDLGGEVRRWSGVRTAGQLVPDTEQMSSCPPSPSPSRDATQTCHSAQAVS